jgi:ankyrin repeat protein
MMIKLALFAFALSMSIASRATADDSIMKTLFRNDGEGFTPPANNQALQALLATKPALSFLEACGVGDTAEMTRQLKRDPKLATTWTGFGWSALHLAAFSGVPAAVQLLLDRGADIQARARTRFKNTPLQVALLPGQLATAKLLLEHGADPLVRQAHGFTPLQEAALLGRRDLVDLLLGAGAELNSRSDDGRTAVTEAVRGKHTELADYLRSKGGRGGEITADLNAVPVD